MVDSKHPSVLYFSPQKDRLLADPYLRSRRRSRWTSERDLLVKGGRLSRVCSAPYKDRYAARRSPRPLVSSLLLSPEAKGRRPDPERGRVCAYPDSEGVNKHHPPIHLYSTPEKSRFLKPHQYDDQHHLLQVHQHQHHHHHHHHRQPRRRPSYMDYGWMYPNNPRRVLNYELFDQRCWVCMRCSFSLCHFVV